MTKNLLEFFNSNPLKKNQIIGGPDQDDADSIISSAALRFLSAEKQIWKQRGVFSILSISNY